MGVTPSFRLVQLRDELKYWRETAKLTQEAVAERQGWTQGKLQKIESGLTKTIKPADLTALLNMYRVPREEAEELRKMARTGVSTRGTYTAPRAVPRWFRRYYSLESQARVLRALNPDVPHGLLQHPDYVRLQFELNDGVNIDSQMKTRLERQRLVLDGPSPPDCTFVLCESVLMRTMGDRRVWLTQLRHMLQLSQLPYITLLVIPFEARLAYVGHEFALMQFDQAVGSDVAYYETELGATYLDGEKDLRKYLRRWEFVRSAALPELDSRALVQAKISQLEVEV